MIDISPYYYLPPVVQFTTVDDFIADLDAGHTLVVYHGLDDSPHGVRHTIVRALVLIDNHVHIAALAFKAVPLIIVDDQGIGRAARGDELRDHEQAWHTRLIRHITNRLAAIGILTVLPGHLSIPHVLAIRYIDAPGESNQ